MSEIRTVHLYYVKDVKTGNIIPINVRGGKTQQEKINRDLKKRGQEHLIRFIVLSDEEVRAHEESLKPSEKKAGRPKKENK